MSPWGRKPPEYIFDLLQHRIREDLVNRKALRLPEYDAAKKDLPARSDYVGALAWLKAVKACLGEDVVFALDEALMCIGFFGGRNDEYLVKYTDFNRTLSDAIANESLLDMQGIIEALSKYYFTNGESFHGLCVAPEYQERFDLLANEAMEYYDS